MSLSAGSIGSGIRAGRKFVRRAQTHTMWFVIHVMERALGIGIAYVGPLSYAMRWLPRWKGVAGGCVVAGFGLGALIFNQVQSSISIPII